MTDAAWLCPECGGGFPDIDSAYRYDYPNPNLTVEARCPWCGNSMDGLSEYYIERDKSEEQYESNKSAEPSVLARLTPGGRNVEVEDEDE